MKISEYAVKNYQFTLVILVMAIVVGLTTLINMPRSEDPEIKIPSFTVIVVYPGTSPQDMEELVVDPIEKRISELEDINRIKTNILDGIAIIGVEYKYGGNVNEQYQEIVREINNMRGTLPEDILSIDIKKPSFTDVNILQLALISENAPREQLKKQAESLQEELEKINALQKVEISGLPKQIVRVDLKLDKLAQMHIPLNAVIASIQSEIANIPGGTVYAGNKTFNIKTSGNYKSVEEIENTIVFSIDRKNVRLKDVANVHSDYGLAHSGRHSAGLVSASRFSPGFARVGVRPGDAVECS